MILEHAVLSVRPEATADFEAVFAKASTIISAMPGFGGLELCRCIEAPATYLLLVRWQRLTDHTEGFRGSAAYDEWRRLLHHFYEPFPEVRHFERILVSG